MTKARLDQPVYFRLKLWPVFIENRQWQVPENPFLDLAGGSAARLDFAAGAGGKRHDQFVNTLLLEQGEIMQIAEGYGDMRCIGP